MAVLFSGEVLGQVDSTRFVVNRPRKALLRALVPGWGQLYNRQYVKIPVVYAGMGGLVYAALYMNGRYIRYRHAYLFTAREDGEGSPVFPQYMGDYAALLRDLNLTPEAELSLEEIAARRARLEPQIRRRRDRLRRNRDLLYFAIVGWYGLTILDAFISAHLLDFDVGGDLTIRFGVYPSSRGLTATARWDL